MRKFFAALGLLAALAAPAQAQTTQATVTAAIASTFPDNTTGAITPAGVRTFMTTLNGAVFQAQGANGLNLSNPAAAGQVAVSTGATGASWTATPALGANGGTGGQLTLNGATSSSTVLVVSATGGHVNHTGGVAPTLTAGCNGAGSVVSGNDTTGTITGQTAAATTCTLSFGTAYGAAPNCVASGLTSPLTGAITPTTASLVVNFASTANFKFTYICFGT
jgi:hypothetical protein